MITEPKIENHSEQYTVGIRTEAAISELPIVIPQVTTEVYQWLEAQGIEPAGSPFIRYHVINMAEKLDIELGVPVASAVAGNGRVVGSTLPAGRYATLTYIGDYSGLMGANGVLIGWAQEKGIAWDRWDHVNGDAFRSRYESYIKDPSNEPDPAKWETEVAIKVAD